MNKSSGKDMVKDECPTSKATCVASSSSSEEEEEESTSTHTSLLQSFTNSKFTDFIFEEMLGRLRRLNVKTENIQNDKVEKVLTLDEIARQMREGHYENVITLVGAGISTSAGIPDFRSPKSGLYNNLGKYNLPNAQAIFEYDYFVENPAPFFDLARELIPDSILPTKAHYFIRMLLEKKLLLRHYTQNVDNLDRQAGIPEGKLVEAHGTFNTSHCIKCKKLYSLIWMKEKIITSLVPKCENCGGVVKPDIIFFGETLPSRFFSNIRTDFQKCDLLIIMGTSLTVEPFATTVERVADKCPRIIINATQVGENVGISYSNEGNSRDFFIQGTCDDGCQKLVELFGWEGDFQKLLEDVKGKTEFTGLQPSRTSDE